jgi:hypothetical protein
MIRFSSRVWWARTPTVKARPTVHSRWHGHRCGRSVIGSARRLAAESGLGVGPRRFRQQSLQRKVQSAVTPVTPRTTLPVSGIDHHGHQFVGGAKRELLVVVASNYCTLERSFTRIHLCQLYNVYWLAVCLLVWVLLISSITPLHVQAANGPCNRSDAVLPT